MTGKAERKNCEHILETGNLLAQGRVAKWWDSTSINYCRGGQGGENTISRSFGAQALLVGRGEGGKGGSLLSSRSVLYHNWSPRLPRALLFSSVLILQGRPVSLLNSGVQRLARGASSASESIKARSSSSLASAFYQIPSAPCLRGLALPQRTPFTSPFHGKAASSLTLGKKHRANWAMRLL